MLGYEWGFTCPNSIPNGLTFRVNGTSYKGRLRVLYNNINGTYKIIQMRRVKRSIENIKEDELPNVLRIIINKAN